jgi:hypothetical protein
MAVQRYPDPPLTPTSQEAGGCVHDQSLAQTAPGSAPGFDGGVLSYPVSTDAPPVPRGPDRDDRRPAGPSGALAGGKDSPFPQAGSFGQAGREDSGNAGRWRPTPSSS